MPWSAMSTRSRSARCRQTFGGLPAKASLTPVADVEAGEAPQREFIPLDVPPNRGDVGGPGIKRHDPNFMAGMS